MGAVQVRMWYNSIKGRQRPIFGSMTFRLRSIIPEMFSCGKQQGAGL